MSPAPGTPVGVSLLTPDPDAAAAFYAALLGWSREASVLSAPDGSPVADIRSPGALAPGWLVALHAEAGATGEVEAAGGRSLGDGLVTDPAGAVFALGAPAVPLPARGPGRPAWFENMTTDAARADAFYGAVFGLQPQAAGDGYALLTAGGRPVAGRLELPPDLATAVGPRWMTYFAHADVDAGAAAVADLGGTVAVPPRDTPTGRVSAVVDPLGVLFTLLTPA
ncbi:MAG TPA: VOC family protein [Pseudonocardia sp.]|nr:VOC family protein [Pseudonocardia sp.]